jgi:hypothetical protein
VNDRPKNADEVFTLLDFLHTTGTDPLMMANGHEITAISPWHSAIDGFRQAIMRERNHLTANRQTRDPSIQKGTEEGAGHLKAILTRLARNTAQDITRQQGEAVNLQLCELTR